MNRKQSGLPALITGKNPPPQEAHSNLLSPCRRSLGALRRDFLIFFLIPNNTAKNSVIHPDRMTFLEIQKKLFFIFHQNKPEKCTGQS